MLRKILSLASNSDFFGIYDNALTKEECQILINKFENSTKREGRSYSNGDLIVKEDMVVTLSYGGYVKVQPLNDYNTHNWIENSYKKIDIGFIKKL